MSDMVDRSRVLIVIPCLNEEAHLARLLEWLLDDAAGATIVVADGGSVDESRAIVSRYAAAKPDVHLLDNPRRLQSAALNLAAARFGDGRAWLIRIDAHCRYPDGYVDGLLAAAGRNGATSVVVPMVTIGRGCFQRAVAAAQNSVLGTGGSLHRHIGQGRFVDHGHHALFGLDLFRRVGGYDESFSHNEDAELDLRQRAAGGRIWLEPGLAIGYWPRSTPSALFRQYRGYGSGRARTTARHAQNLKLRQWLPVTIAPLAGLAVLGCVLGPFAPAMLVLALPALVWAAAALGYGVVLGIRAGSWCAAGSGWAAMIMHFGWSLGYLSRWRTAEGPFRQAPLATPGPSIGTQE